MKPTKVNLLGRPYTVRIEPIQCGSLGLCDPPTKRSRSIRVSDKLKGQEQLDVFIHEMLHGCHPYLSEEMVDDTATALAAALWKLGYRLPE